MKKTGLVLGLSVFCLCLLPVRSASAQNFDIIDQQLDANRHGYTVMRVWGTRYEMGYAMGVALAPDIVTGLQQVRDLAGNDYSLIRAAMSNFIWLPQGIEDEMEGIVDGTLSVYPQEQMDVVDAKAVNTYSDWAYYTGCRSHSCWGSLVQAPVGTLSTRRLDYSTPFDVALHHVLCAWDPSDGSERWVNLAWAGFVTVITAVNAHGTVSSLHDYGSGATISANLLPRSVAARHILTGMGNRPLSEHVTWAQQELNSMDIATSSFINYYAPEGHGGVFTCSRGGPCGQLRTPQSDYFNGEVLITTNDQTDGHSVPWGGQFMHDYYAAGGPKTLQDHFDVMGLTGLHLMSVEYRGHEDMTIWFHGRDMPSRVEVEWDDLYTVGPRPDGGVMPDGGTGADGGIQPDGGTGADEGGGCGCRTLDASRAGGGWLFLLFGLLVAVRFIRRRKRQR